ncbi:NAD(P)/FAD-dependent oxidoreductase [Streptomyces sp. NPDC051561]|uniref:NAD(P)/FAD-dependent oxidoreductase n=1 Tax=Streptomyces sp. NPDC051561 TaxID=3365658 RepID=UPI00378E06CE
MTRPRIVVVGAGFVGIECLHRLERKLAPRDAELILISPQDYQLYLPLLPHVAAGVLTPQSVAVSLRRRLRRTKIVPGVAIGIDAKAKVCVVRRSTGEVTVKPYDHLVIAAGSTTRTFDIPGLTDHALGVKTLAQAAYIRDHVIAQLDLAAATVDQEERAARLQFVVVGGGYAGVETAACLQRLTTNALKRYPRLDPTLVRWHLVDVAPRLLPELGERLGVKAMAMLRERGIEFSLGTSVAAVDETTVKLTDGRTLPSRTLIWTAGVAASPLVGTIGAETVRGRITATNQLTVPGFEGLYAAGDVAAVPDDAKGGDAICPPTAQHAQRQGKVLADNIVANMTGAPLKPYHHKDLGLVVDLGGADAVSKPLGIELHGLPAQVVARGYHVMALPTFTARTRVLVNWGLNAVAGDDFVRTDFQDSRPKTLQDFERTKAYLSAEEVREHSAMLNAGTA